MPHVVCPRQCVAIHIWAIDDNEGCNGARIDSLAVRTVAEGGGGRGRNQTTQQSTVLSMKKNDKQCQVVRGGRWRCSLPLLLLWGPLIDRPGSATVDDGVEANETIGRSNNQPWGVVEKEGDDCGVVLLEVVCPENTTMNNCWWTTQQLRRGETTIQQPR